MIGRDGRVLRIAQRSLPGRPGFMVTFDGGSPWHDIPLNIPAAPVDASHSIPMVVEIPRGTTAKLEMSLELPGNPIVQDVRKDGSLRSYLHDAPTSWNYGFIPQTWEDPNRVYQGFQGDGDPVDILELRGEPRRTGDIIDVRVKGMLGLIDDGELDWKVLAVAAESDDGTELEEREIDEVRRWFAEYKIAEGGKRNQFLRDGAFVGREETFELLRPYHRYWKEHHDKLKLNSKN